MAVASRTSNAIKNSQYALLISLGQFLLSFLSRGIFLEYLGADVLGLNTTAQNLLSFLNLAELGIGTAVAVTLYKPLHNSDFESIHDIISLQGWFYKRIATLILIGAGVLMCFFPIIFEDMTLPLWYAFASFGAYLVSSILGYFVNFRQIILSANQEQYKILLNSNVTKMGITILQLVAIYYFEDGYVWWLIIQVLGAILISYLLHRSVHRSHPYLRSSKLSGRELRIRYPEVLTKIKQAFFHRMGSFVLYQAQPLLIYAFSSLATVAYYGNYMLIISGLNLFSNSVFNGLNASVGNLVAAGDRERILKIFEELYSSRFFMASVMALASYILAPHFIDVWIGEQYVMATSTLILLLVLFFIEVTRGVVDVYINAYGLFKDIYTPLFEAVVNLTSSIAFGYIWGINGVLCGAILSTTLVVLLWKPYFLFSQGIGHSVRHYVAIFIKHHLTAALLIVVIYLFGDKLYVDYVDGKYLNFIINGTIITLALSLVQFTMLMAISRGMRDFTTRFKSIIKSKIRR